MLFKTLHLYISGFHRNMLSIHLKGILFKINKFFKHYFIHIVKIPRNTVVSLHH